MKVLLISDERINVGDDIIREGVIYLLQKAAGESNIQFEITSVHDLSTIYDGNGVDKVLGADLVVVSGMPFYWYFTYPHLKKGVKVPFLKRLKSHPYLMEWTDALWTQRIIKEKKKVILLGVGSCQPYHQSAFEMIQPVMERFVRDTSTATSLITVRDRIAHDLLSYYSIPHLMLPCPSIFAKRRFSIRANRRDYVVINFMKNGGHYLFDYKVDSRRWLNCVRAFHDWLNREQGEAVVFSCHDEKELELQRRHFPNARSFYSQDYKEYVEFYAGARMGFVNRVHAGFPIYSFGNPVLAIGTDTRVKITELVGMYHEFVNDVTVEKLMFYYHLFKTAPFDYSVIDATEDRYLAALKGLLD